MAFDYTAKINDLRAQRAEKIASAEALISAGKLEEGLALKDEIAGMSSSIAGLEALASESEERAEPIPSDVPKDGKDVRPFACLGEQLQAVHAAATKHVVDRRLVQVNDAILGSNETSGADGGFAVQTDFAGEILESAVQSSELLSRIDRYTVGANSNSARWLMIDETDVSATVFGGVQMYWAAEGSTVAASRPKFRELKLDLEKMMGFAYATDELLEDAAFMTGFFGTAFAVAADRLLTEAIISGDGAGKPLGILNSGALISVAKDADQAAGTLTGQNILNMWQRAMTKNRANMIWLMHPDLESQLPTLSITDGTSSKFLWNPEGGLRLLDYQSILNRPVVFDDNCSAVGSKGDIMLIDPKEYMLLQKGSVKQDWSMHVAFLTDQNCFRIIFRCNGAPKKNKPVKIKNSSNTRSPFVTLAART